MCGDDDPAAALRALVSVRRTIVEAVQHRVGDAAAASVEYAAWLEVVALVRDCHRSLVRQGYLIGRPEPLQAS